MATHIVRYRTHPERIDENRRLIEAVFAELHAHPLAGVHYTASCTADGVFTHVVSYDGADEPQLPKLASFRAFQAGIRERCIEPPVRAEVTVIGTFG